jgi:lambda family phage tail tape measure protein
LSTFFTTLVSHTVSAKEAFRTMAVSIIKSMMDVVAQALAMRMIQSIVGAFMGGGSSTYSLASGPAVSSGGTGLSPGANFGGGIKFAKGGPIRGGIPGKDSVGVLAMPGEFMLKKSAVDAVGENFLHDLNNQTNSTVASSAGHASSVNRREPDLTNVWIVAPEAKPTMGPKDVLMVITDDMMRGGATRQLVKQIQSGG